MIEITVLSSPGAGSPPSNTVAPSVTGTTTVGQVLTATNGSWNDDGSPSFSNQWQRDGHGNNSYSNIAAATSSTYTLVDADDGCKIRCVVTNTTPDGAVSANSNVVGLVVEPTPTNSVAPTVSGLAPEGSTLTATTGTWAHMGGFNPAYTYQWKRAGVDIASATASTYVTAFADVGLAVTCTVTATNTGNSASQGSSNSVTPTSAGFHTGTLTGYMVMVEDIVAEWNIAAATTHARRSGDLEELIHFLEL